MITNTKFIFASALAVTLFSATSVSAQQQPQYNKPVTFGLAVGASLPTSEMRDDYRPGVNLGFDGQFRSWGSPVALRIEGSYDRFSGERNGPFRTQTQQILSARANIVYDVGGDVVKLYIIGGAGAYSRKFEGSDDWSGGKLGFNAGAGVNVPAAGLPLFIEARWHHIATSGRSTNYIPLVVGLRF